MKIKVIVRSCGECGKRYKFSSQKYFNKYCNCCICEKKESKQRRLDFKMKSYMSLKYGGISNEV